jgi:hypothetical protein
MNTSSFSSSTTRAIHKFPHRLTSQQIKICAYRYQLDSDGTTDIQINEVDGQTVMLYSINQATLEQDWQKLLLIAQQVTQQDEAPLQEQALIIDPNRAYTRPQDLFRSELVRRGMDGTLSLLGSAAELYYRIDELFLQFAQQEKALPFHAQPIWQHEDLKLFGYEENSKNLCRLNTHSGEIFHLWQTAVCNNIWKALKDTVVSNPIIHTARGTCCRHEGNQHYLMEYMKAFTMREITIAGTPDQVKAFRKRALAFLEKIAHELELNAVLKEANDPFFLMDATGKTVQDPDIAKTELRLSLYDGKSLACASINVHGDFFAKHFSISGETSIWTGCLAFGLERWVWACLSQFGPEPKHWPPEIRQLVSLPK